MGVKGKTDKSNVCNYYIQKLLLMKCKERKHCALICVYIYRCCLF